MNKEELYYAIGTVDEELLQRSERLVQKTIQRKLFKWGAIAACLCLVITGAIIWSGSQSINDNGVESGGGPVQGGTVPEGVDPIVASYAVIPANETLEDVADAICTKVNEDEAKNIEQLGAYIPKELPDGYYFGTAGYYKTTMKDGTVYHMIRVTYESGEPSIPAPVLENAQQELASECRTAFVWMVCGHLPDTNRNIYNLDQISVEIIDERDGEFFYVDYDGVYVGVSKLEISSEDMLKVIESIR